MIAFTRNVLSNLTLNSILQFVANTVDERLRITTEYQVVSNFPNFVVFENHQAAIKFISVVPRIFSGGGVKKWS
jgi:hypothetical protein